MIRTPFEYLNLIFVLFFIVGSIFFQIILPIFFDSYWLYSLLVFALFSNVLWVLIHEGIHYSLFKNRTLNNFFTRILSIVFGAPFRVLQIGHMLHHSFNRTEEEVTDLYNPTKTSSFFAYVKYYFWILGGLYYVELLSNFLIFIPKSILEKLKEKYQKSKFKFNFFFMTLIHLKEIRIDAKIILFFYGLVFFLYGQNWYIVVLFLLIRGYLISIMDNVYHYGTKERDVIFGYNLKMPKIMEILLLNSNLHGLHHEKGNIPWYLAREYFEKNNKIFHKDFFVQFFSQFKGPIKNYNL